MNTWKKIRAVNKHGAEKKYCIRVSDCRGIHDAEADSGIANEDKAWSDSPGYHFSVVELGRVAKWARSMQEIV